MPTNNWYPGKWYFEMINDIFRLLAWPFMALFRLGKQFWSKFIAAMYFEDLRKVHYG